MIKITKSSGPDANIVKNVVFNRTSASGRKRDHYIEAIKKSDGEYTEARINIPATGDLLLEDIPEFIKAIRLAVMIASGELEIE